MPRDPNLGPFRYALKAYLDDEKLEVPVLSTVATQLLSIYQNPDVSAGEMKDVIQEDQSLVGNIVRICNSPVFAGSRPVTSLQLAIARLGTRNLSRIAITSIMKGKVFTADGFTSEVKQNWLLSQLSSSLCISLSEHARINPEEAFLAGLLHLAGRPVILQSLDELKVEFGMDLQRDSELALADEFHPRVGGAVATGWGLSESIAYASAFYRHVNGAPDDFRDMAHLVQLANRIAHYVVGEEDEEEATESIAASAPVQELDIAPFAIKRLLQQKQALKNAASSY